MPNKYLEELLVECKEAFVSLNIEMRETQSKAYKTYLKVKAQLKNRCASCGLLMDAQNCCVIDVKENKMYHVGCEPKIYCKPKRKKMSEQEKILKNIETSKMDDSTKIDLVLEIVWGLMNRK